MVFQSAFIQRFLHPRLLNTHATPRHTQSESQNREKLGETGALVPGGPWSAGHQAGPGLSDLLRYRPCLPDS